MFKKVDKLKKGQYVRINGQLFMLGYKRYVPFLMHCMHGTVMQGSAVKSFYTWSGMDETLFKTTFERNSFVRNNAAAIEFVELVEDEAVPATVGSHIMVTSPGPSSSYVPPVPFFTVTSS